MAKVPTEKEFVLKFTAINCEAYVANEIIENMKYTQTGERILLKKFSEGSPGDVGSKADYTFEIKKDGIRFLPVKEGCDARSGTCKEDVFVKQK